MNENPLITSPIQDVVAEKQFLGRSVEKKKKFIGGYPIMSRSDEDPTSIRLIVKSSSDYNVEGEICLVDFPEAAAAAAAERRQQHNRNATKDILMMEHIIEQISIQMTAYQGIINNKKKTQPTIDRLCHVVYGHRDTIQGIAQIKSPKLLRDMDVVVAMTKKRKGRPPKAAVAARTAAAAAAVAMPVTSASVTDDSVAIVGPGSARKKPTSAKKRKSAIDDDDDDDYIPPSKNKKQRKKKQQPQKDLLDDSDDEFVYNEGEDLDDDEVVLYDDDNESNASSSTAPTRTRYIGFGDEEDIDDEDMIDMLVDEMAEEKANLKSKAKARAKLKAQQTKQQKQKQTKKKKQRGRSPSKAKSKPQEQQQEPSGTTQAAADVVVGGEPKFLDGLPSPPRRSNKLYKVGTKVRKLFVGYGWYEGRIILVDMVDRKYKIQYDDGDVEDIFMDEEQDIIDQIVYLATPAGRKAVKDMKKSHGTGHFKSIINTNKDVSLTDEQRSKLYGKEIDLDFFVSYLKDVEDIEDYNYRRVVKEVKVFRSGEGQRYDKWTPKGIAFYEGRPFGRYLHENYTRLRHEAKEFQKVHCGVEMKTKNPCLLIQPLRKLENYQIYYYNKYNNINIKHNILTIFTST